MAWTSPRTWVVSEFVTAALLNTHVRDNLLFLKSDPQIARATQTTTQTTTGGGAQVTVITMSGVVIPSDVGAVYVEAWAAHFGHTAATSTTGWVQVRIEETTAGMLRRGGNNGGLTQRYGTGTAAALAPLYLRTDDLAWAGSTRTITLVIQASATEARIVGDTDNPIVMRVMRSY